MLFFLLSLMLAPARAELPPKEIAARETKLREALALLKRVATQAKADRRTGAALDVIHIGRTAFDETLDRTLSQTDIPIRETLIDYRKSDEETHCEESRDWGGHIVAYVLSSQRRIVLCKAAFKDVTRLSNTILHEFVHVQGIVDECDAEGIAYLAFRLAGERYPLGDYNARCKSIRDLRAELSS